MDFSPHEGVRYELDHLATFTVSNRHGLLHPEDGIRKLKMMDSTTGIWTMRCTMVVNPAFVYIIDKQSGETMEQFPIHLIIDPMSVSSRGPNEVYSNILLFTVLEDPKKISSPTEMHIFQCVHCSAEAVANDLKRIKHKAPALTLASHSPAQNANRVSTNGHSDSSSYVRDRVYNFNAMASTDNARLMASRRPKENGQMPNASDEMTSEKVDRDVNILNHCFDDIEKFVGRLQLVAGARKELERRKKSRGKKSKKNHGDKDSKNGLLVMRARPPPKEEFIDTFKKFKLAFNLLARLRPFIHDPNSAELVHCLMTPLSLVVGASKDPVNEMPDVVLRIVSPLLTYEGKELLTHCLSSKEHEFWMSLGEAWTLSREQWNSFVPPFYPKFGDGWEPYAQSLDGDAKAGIETAVATRAAHVRRQEETSLAKYEAEDHVMSYPRTEGREFSDTVYRDQLQRQESSQGSRMDIDYTLVTNAATSRGQPAAGPDPKVAGYQAYVEKHIDRNLHVQEEARRRSDYGLNSAEQAQFLAQLKKRGAKIYQVTHERSGRNAKELSVAKGEYLEILDDSRNWWKMRNQSGTEGYVPFTILKQVVYDVTPTSNGTAGHPAPPPPPPPPPAPVPPPVLPVSQMQSNYASRNNNNNYKQDAPPKKEQTRVNPRGSAKDDLHDELKKRMSVGVKDGSKLMRPVSKYISQESSVADVREWLISKGFSQRVLKMTSEFNGADLLSLSKKEIYHIGQDGEEGSHLDSQLTVQKNISGFGTLGLSELNAILHDRKRRADLANLGQPPPFVPPPPPRSEASDSSDEITTYGSNFVMR